MVDVSALRQANAIDDVIARAGVALRPMGRRLVGRCPLHPDRHPSLVIYPDSQSYFCFGCSAGGDVIDFVGRLHGVGFKEAAALLGAPAGGRGGLSGHHPPVPRVGGRCTDDRTGAEAEVIYAAATFYHHALWRSRTALAYLAARGVDRTTARICGLGFGAQGLVDELRHRGLSLEVAQHVGLLTGARESMRCRIVIPELKERRATWLTGRALGSGGPRYLSLRLPAPLLGLERVRGDEVLVTEGPFDWLTAVQWGLPAVGLLGTHVSHPTAQALRGFRRVYLALDADAAGRRATAELASLLGRRAVVVELPRGANDLNELARLPAGDTALRRCIEAALHGKEKRWDTSVAPSKRAA